MGESARVMGLNASQQVILQAIHSKINMLQRLLKALIILSGLFELLARLYRRSERALVASKNVLLYVIALLSRVLLIYMHRDAAIADIDIDEEDQVKQEQQEKKKSMTDRLTFDSISSVQIRHMTRFSPPSLVLLKRYFALSEHIFLHPNKDGPRQYNNLRNGCYHFLDKELILFSLYRFAHGVSIAIATDKFSSSSRKW